MDLDNELNRNGETRFDEDIQDGNFLAIKPHYDRREHAHHSNFAENKVFHNIIAKNNQSEISMQYLKEFKSVYLQKFDRLELKCVYKKCNFGQFFGSFKYVTTCKNAFGVSLLFMDPTDVARVSGVGKFSTRARRW